MGPGLLSTFELSPLSLSWPIFQHKETTTQGAETMNVDPPRFIVCSLLSLKARGTWA